MHIYNYIPSMCNEPRYVENFRNMLQRKVTFTERHASVLRETGFFSGKNCRTNTNECSSSPCQNGATCKDAVNGYNCACVAGYEGVYCETDTDDCSSDPCQNGGSCTDEVNGYSCECSAGYEGLLL